MARVKSPPSPARYELTIYVPKCLAVDAEKVLIATDTILSFVFDLKHISRKTLSKTDLAENKPSLFALAHSTSTRESCLARSLMGPSDEQNRDHLKRQTDRDKKIF